MVIWLIGSPILNMILEGYSLFGLLVLLVSILAAISVIVMMIGVNKVKLSYMRQFKFSYLIYLLLMLAASIYIGIQAYNESYINDAFKEFRKDSSNEKKTDDEVRRAIKFSALMMAIFIFAFFLVSAYYFLCTCSFIEDIEECIGEEYKVRDFEKAHNSNNALNIAYNSNK